MEIAGGNDSGCQAHNEQRYYAAFSCSFCHDKVLHAESDKQNPHHYTEAFMELQKGVCPEQLYLKLFHIMHQLQRLDRWAGRGNNNIGNEVKKSEGNNGYRACFKVIHGAMY